MCTPRGQRCSSRSLRFLGWLQTGAPRTFPRRTVHPVVVLMDSPLEGRVYDQRTAASGGTNADDVSDALGGLGLVVHKENTNPLWHREEQVVAQNPDLLVAHLSCLFDARVAARVQPPTSICSRRPRTACCSSLRTRRPAIPARASSSIRARSSRKSAEKKRGWRSRKRGCRCSRDACAPLSSPAVLEARPSGTRDRQGVESARGRTPAVG